MRKLITISIFVSLSLAFSCNKTLLDVRDKQSYKIAKINGLWWTTQNMNFSADEFKYYNLDSANRKKSGKMYNWEQVQQVCPTGWRLPTEKELIDLLLPYGKISYSGEYEQFTKIFGPYAPEKTETTYFNLIKDKKLNIPVFDRNAVDNQRTMIWTSGTTNDSRAYAIYWRTVDQYIKYNSVHFSDYPKDYYGFCRCVKND